VSERAKQVIDEVIAELRQKGYVVTPPPPPQPVNHCAVCGISKDEDSEPLIPVDISINPGEEGASYVTRWYCDEDLETLAYQLIRYGLGSHHHGSTTLVEADTEVCGGYGKCTLYNGEDGMQEVYRGGSLDARPT
jgi:hypothetical protein